MHARALTSLGGGRPREGDEVVADINPAAPDDVKRSELGAAGLAVPVPASGAVRA
jgi:hypothetical protein